MYFPPLLTDHTFSIAESHMAAGSSGRLSCTSALLCKVGVEIDDTFCLSVSKNGSRLYTGHHEKVKIWKFEQERTPLKSGWEFERTIVIPVKDDVMCICEAVDKDSQLLLISVGSSIIFYNHNLDEPIRQVSFNEQDINQLDVHSNGHLVCVCDDSGDVRVFDVKSFSLLKTLRSHDNICSTVKFVPRKPWELISGGLDCKLIRWDFNRGRPLTILNQVDLLPNSDDTDVSGNYSINPPMVHCIDIFPLTSTVVCGLGNGTILAYSLRSGKEVDLLSVGTFHSKSVACVCCVEITKPETKTTDQFVVSGGNDGNICVIQFKKENEFLPKLKKQTAGTGHCLELTTQWDNQSKINWVSVLNCNVDKTESVLRVFVADLTSSVSVYHCTININ